MTLSTDISTDYIVADLSGKTGLQMLMSELAPLCSDFCQFEGNSLQGQSNWSLTNV